MGGQAKKARRRARQERLLRFFNHQEKDCYEEMPVGTKVFVKQFNGNSKLWQVAVFTRESFKKYKTYRERNKSMGKKDVHLEHFFQRNRWQRREDVEEDKKPDAAIPEEKAGKKPRFKGKIPSWG